MLYVTYKIEGVTNDRSWHIGSEWRTAFDINDIIGMQADGDELDKIRDMFPAITPQNVRVAMWVGDIAKTIACNLQLATY